MLSLLMTSTRIQNEALHLALTDMKLCVNGVRGSRGWSAVIQDSDRPTPFIDTRLFVPARETADCSCFPWSATLPPWKGNLLLKSLKTLTLSADFLESLRITITICFNGQESVDVSFPCPYRFREEKYTETERKNDRAIAKLKADTLSRVKFFQFANRELIDGVMDDLSNVGWHTSLEIDWSDRSSDNAVYNRTSHVCEGLDEIWQCRRGSEALRRLDHVFCVQHPRYAYK
jgi:hypothetical protein